VSLLRELLYGVSSQRPSHSVFIGGQELPLEARMGGIFLGFLCAAVLLAILGRLSAAHPPRGGMGLACWVLIALTGLDGLNAFFFDGNLPHLYAPSTAVRLFTGLGAGVALGLLALPVVGSIAAKRPRDEASIEDPVELASGLAMAALVGGVVLAGAPLLLWPIAVAMLASVLLAFGSANLYLMSLLVRRGADRGVLLSSLGLALIELAALSTLRTWLASAFGFTWGV
jgi:uncharacterized membrane protein